MGLRKIAPYFWRKIEPQATKAERRLTLLGRIAEASESGFLVWRADRDLRWLQSNRFIEIRRRPKGHKQWHVRHDNETIAVLTGLGVLAFAAKDLTINKPRPKSERTEREPWTR